MIIHVEHYEEFVSSPVIEKRLKKEAEELLSHFKNLGKEIGVDTKTYLVKGNHVEEIIKIANEDDLIVMASHGKKGFDRLLLGSVSEEVIHLAPCSVLIVKPVED